MSREEFLKDIHSKDVETPEHQFTEQMLKDRYETPYRNYQAEKLLNERKRIREENIGRKTELNKQLEDIGTRTTSFIEQDSQNLLEANIRLLHLIDTVNKQKQDLRFNRDSRGVLERLKYKVVSDPTISEEIRLSELEDSYREEYVLNKDKIAEIEDKWRGLESKRTEAIQRLLEEQSDGYREDKKKLLEKTRSINTDSKNAIRNTLEALNRGSLDIRTLAEENNAIVVHSIPIDGWSMKNTSMNNKEIDITNLSSKEKANILLETKPDVSASVLSTEKMIDGQELFYPFGFIVDGKIIASYAGDEGTYTDGNVRRRKEIYHGTLQKEVGDNFSSIASLSAGISQGGQYNESIVHAPEVKGIIIDETELENREDLADSVVEDYSPEEEDGVLSKYADRIISTAKGIPQTGSYAGKSVFRIERSRTAMEKALEYAKQNHKDLPIYIRRRDGVYTTDNRKVTAREIYS